LEPPKPEEDHRRLESWEENKFEEAKSWYRLDGLSAKDRSSTTPAKQVLRPYQQELLEQALDENVIVCLPTGTGKTLIAFRLMERMVVKEGRLGRPIVFINQNISLMFQQASACEHQTNLRVGKYCGGEYQVGGQQIIKESGLASLWRQEVAKKDALFFTGGLFQSLCDKGILSLADFSLLVVDEAHHTKKRHEFNLLMMGHYFTLEEHGQDRPKVLALTATASEPRADISATVLAILKTAKDLDSILVVPTSEAAKSALFQATNLPDIKFETVKSHVEFESWAEAFKWYILDVVGLLHKHCLPEHMLSVENCSKLLQAGTLLDTVDRLFAWADGDKEREPLQFLLRHLLTLIEDCDIVTGFLASRLLAMSETLADLKKNWGASLPPSASCAEASRDLATIINKSILYTKMQDGSIQSLGDIMSPRTSSLLNILAELVNTLPSDATVMVFTTTRAACVALTEVVNQSFRGGHGGTCFRPRADYIIGKKLSFDCCAPIYVPSVYIYKVYLTSFSPQATEIVWAASRVCRHENKLTNQKLSSSVISMYWFQRRFAKKASMSALARLESNTGILFLRRSSRSSWVSLVLVALLQILPILSCLQLIPCCFLKVACEQKRALYT
jgi:hypothetical protein